MMPCEALDTASCLPSIELSPRVLKGEFDQKVLERLYGLGSHHEEQYIWERRILDRLRASIDCAPAFEPLD
jgi:hypothetical protein